jgi:hypothetical protein
VRNAAFPKEFKVYRVSIFYGSKLTWKYEVAAPDRKDAQDSGHAWIEKYDPEVARTGHYRVSTMRKIEDREPARMWVIAG